MSTHDFTSAVAFSATPSKVASSPALSAYRDIKATGAPPAVKRCWRAVAAQLPAAGPIMLTYKQIAAKARCTQRTAQRAIAFGLAVGCIERETAKRHQRPGDCWNLPNRYTWTGPPAAPIVRGHFAAFLAREEGRKCHPEANRKCHPYVQGTTNTRNGEETTPAGGNDYEQPTVRQGGAHRGMAALGMGGR